jgi:hypothetical protein
MAAPIGYCVSPAHVFLASLDAHSRKMVLKYAIQHHSGESMMEDQIGWFKIGIGCTGTLSWIALIWYTLPSGIVIIH